MAKASFSWQQLVNQIPHWSLLEFKTGSPKQRSFKPFAGPGGILSFLTIVVAMLLWNWKLVLALLVGVGVMLLVYSMQKWDWQLCWSQMRQFFNSPNHRLALAVGSGGIATVSTYMAAAIWVDSKSSWIATGIILQGLGTLLTLILLVWQMVSFYGNQEEDNFERLLANLTAQDPLKRLIAIRQLTKIITSKRIDSQMQQAAIPCLQLLLTQEKETVIRDAALESLQALDYLQVQPSSKMATLIPLSTQSQVRISS
ncbi:armadillo-type fold-containing protein [Nostocales cyanobacterium LEGE 11386]|nr:armadillo-type fold-containing protein [Nostocales cyanobacterium LEGE 11386]